jgi:catechol 2,3-dioxygenase-like lactoylglutathione lyase family enzyme
MNDALTLLFSQFDRGTISRRQLLQALGIATVAAPLSAFAQGSCGGANAGTPRCNTTPFPPPFEPTGWKTVLLDHFSMHVVDYQKEAAYYSALMGWKVRSDDGTKAVLDIGDWGGVVIRGGLEVPPPPPAAAPPPAPPVGDSAAGRGGRGGRGGGGGRGPSRAVWDGFCWGIAPWDTKKVEAELTKRGLNPVAEHEGKDFQSFHVKDPDGFDVQVSNGNRKNRRTTPANGKLSAPPPFESTGWKTVWLDHISFQVTSYKESVAFYSTLLGWKPTGDEGSQNECEIGPDIGGVIIRGGNANQPGGLAAGRGGRGGGAGGAGGDTTGGRAAAPAAAAGPLVRRAIMNHVSFGIATFEPDAVKAELDKRGLSAQVDTGGTGDIHATAYKSYHTTTPNGYNLQISNTISR